MDRPVDCPDGAGWVSDRDVTLVHGAAKGADELAAMAAEELGFRVAGYPAQWGKHGRAAGPIRNRVMLDSGIDYVVAFHLNGSRGTADAVREAKKRLIPFRRWIVSGDYTSPLLETWAPHPQLIEP